MSKAEKTKQFVIEQVAPVFNKKGYAATSLKDLVDATGLTKGSIYGNFKNKDEVALCAYKYNVLFVYNALQDNILAAKTNRGKLLAYPKTYLAIHQHILHNGGCPVLNTAVDSYDVNEQLQVAVQKTIASWRQSIISFIEDGMSEGEFSKKTNASQTAYILICLVEGGFAMSKVTQDKSYIENALGYIEDLIRKM
ncbi:TetR/AcrR family transcriptional regulator [Desulfotalea psychrophila]|nr:TetR/AcrR family transcriptional regulator [Desulfotalea psychrophila]